MTTEGQKARTERKGQYAGTQACLLLVAAAGFLIASMAGSSPVFGQAVAGYVVAGALIIWPLIRYHERQAELSTGELEVAS